MYKNQLQELAQRSCFNLPAYTCIREGPDHAPRFKAAVNFNGESFESPSYCSTLRQAEHSAAEVALNALAGRGPSNSLAARILDETGVYKNLLQEVSQRVGASLPAYTTFRTGLGHLPVFTCTVELAGVIYTGDPAKNKKQAEKNAAMSAWLSLKSLVQQTETSYERTHKDEQEHVTVARALQKYLIKARLARLPFPIKFPTLNTRPSTTQQSPSTTSKILPMLCPKSAHRNRPSSPVNNTPAFHKIVRTTQSQPTGVPNESYSSLLENINPRTQKFPAAGAPPYIPVRHCNMHNRMAAPVTIRNAIPVFSAPPMRPTMGMAPPVSVRQAVPVFAAPVRMEEQPIRHTSIKVEDPRVSRSATTQMTDLSFPKLPSLRVEEPDLSFPKLPSLRVEEPSGFKIFPVSMAPHSEVPAVKVDLPPAEALASQVEPLVCSPSGSSKSSDDETRLLIEEFLKELTT